MGTTLALVGRVEALDGGYAASAITLNVFLALFPLLLVVVSVVGLLVGSNHDLTAQLISRLGLTGRAAETFTNTLETAQRSARAGSIIGMIGLAWTGLNVVGAIQHGVNLPYHVRVTGFRARLMGIPWLAGTGVIFVGSFAVSAVIHWLPAWLAPLTVLAGLAVGMAMFLWTFWLLGKVEMPLRSLLPGAILGAVGFEILRDIGAFVVPALVTRSSAVYGSIGVVFVILAWLLLFGRLLVYAAVLNVLVHERHHDAPIAEMAPIPPRGPR